MIDVPGHNGTIALVEDDPGIRDLMAELFTREGLRVLAFGDAEALYRADLATIDCLILDLMLPGEDGLTICQKMRVQAPRLPILMVTAKGDAIDRIIGLELGADDYLAKPFNSRELMARVRSILRRTREVVEAVDDAGNDIFRFSGWTLAIGSRDLVDPSGAAVALTSGEFDLLHAFVAHPRRVVTRDQLLDWTRGRRATPFDRAIDVQLSRLRRKLGDDPRDPAMIRTVRGDGYLFSPAVTR
ncbi:response regulator [Sphingomonas sp. PAMC26645]|uniref:response regulator n=1 Tax=Sphingomonas sp. PAMC26645 TaxID=2565555 RepID=UPI00109DADE9|nr:response regulator [Sphingomonas sp. PAMC26645]QCB43670.1 response regulator [Sphingomonas sp. PAMC26645]